MDYIYFNVSDVCAISSTIFSLWPTIFQLLPNYIPIMDNYKHPMTNYIGLCPMTNYIHLMTNYIHNCDQLTGLARTVVGQAVPVAQQLYACHWWCRDEVEDIWCHNCNLWPWQFDCSWLWLHFLGFYHGTIRRKSVNFRVLWGWSHVMRW